MSSLFESFPSLSSLPSLPSLPFFSSFWSSSKTEDPEDTLAHNANSEHPMLRGFPQLTLRDQLTLMEEVSRRAKKQRDQLNSSIISAMKMNPSSPIDMELVRHSNVLAGHITRLEGQIQKGKDLLTKMKNL